MRLATAANHIGDKVIYSTLGQPDEEGTITGINRACVFVSFTLTGDSQACLPGKLTLVRVRKKKGYQQRR